VNNQQPFFNSYLRINILSRLTEMQLTRMRHTVHGMPKVVGNKVVGTGTRAHSRHGARRHRATGATVHQHLNRIHRVHARMHRMASIGWHAYKLRRVGRHKLTRPAHMHLLIEGWHLLRELRGKSLTGPLHGHPIKKSWLRLHSKGVGSHWGRSSIGIDSAHPGIHYRRVNVWSRALAEWSKVLVSLLLLLLLLHKAAHWGLLLLLLLLLL